MLPRAHRMTRSSEFGAAVRHGARARSGVLVLHHLVPGSPESSEAAGSPSPARVGLVVNKAVGNSVERHRVSRRLRAQLAARLDALPAGSSTVVRALPPASAADSTSLGRDLDRALSRLARTSPR
ncbi:ribonuclease P protein component [Jatrophihabitans fulvus]